MRRRLLARAGQQGRSDDTPEVIDHRLRLYAEETHPLVDYYMGRGILVDVDADCPVETVTDQVLAALR